VDEIVGRSESGLSKVLLVVDAQEVFLCVNDWHIPSFSGIIENISALANFFGGSTLFSKHVPPSTSAKGTWNDFYKNWNYIGSDATIWDIATPLKGLKGTEFAKATYSCFGSPEFLNLINDTSHLVIAGVETDCCVMATVLDAIDLGISITVVTDAITSPSKIAHDGAIEFFKRVPLQVLTATTEEILRST